MRLCCRRWHDEVRSKASYRLPLDSGRLAGPKLYPVSALLVQFSLSEPPLAWSDASDQGTAQTSSFCSSDVPVLHGLTGLFWKIDEVGCNATQADAV